MKKLVCIAVLVLGLSFCLAPPETSATTLLLDQVDPYSGYGYGLYSWTGMTTALNNAFGAGNITVSTSPLDNLSYLLSFNRLWITAGSPGDQLSAAEISNVEAFEATGRRVVLIGENSAWTAWNNSILQTVGGSYSGMDTSDTLHPILMNQLTAGITTLNTIVDGLAVGGTPLFNENVATLWDPSQSVLSLLSVNVIDDTNGAGPGNMQFKVNMADWLAGTSVPEPSTLLLLGSGLAGLAAFMKRLKKA